MSEQGLMSPPTQLMLSGR